MKKIVKTYGKGDTAHDQARQIWPILCACAVFKVNISELGKGLITYGDLSEQMSRPTQAGRNLIRALGAIGHFCVDQRLPALNAIVVNKMSGKPGDDCVLSPDRTLEEEQKEIWKYKWFELSVPSARAFREARERHPFV